MDQKQTLWIVAAAGVFLLVVFGFAAIWSAPSAEPARTIASSGSATNTGWIANAETNKTPQYAPPAENTSDELASADAQNTENELQDETFAEALKENTTVAQISDMTVISQNTTIYELPANKAETTIEVSPTPNRTSNVTATNQAGADALATAKSTKSTSTPTSTATRTQTATATKPATTTATTTKPAATASVRAADTKTATTQYWVQAASFTSKKSADNAVVVLDSNMIPANIFTYQDPKGTLYYRIRVGPYVTKSEAEYWQTKIAKIDTFSDTKSYVTTTTSAR